MEDYKEYVEQQLDQFSKYASLIDDASLEVTPELVNTALANYTNVNVALNAEYQRYKSELQKAERSFQLWWDERFTDVRKENNRLDIAGTKWISYKEIASETRMRYKEEYDQWASHVQELEDRVNFLRRLLDQWEKHGHMLAQLGQNMRAEMQSLGVQDRVNATNKVRTQFSGNGKSRKRVPKNNE